MKLGATFPQTEIGNDPAGIRDFAQAAEALGYDYLLAYDHVLGADRRVRPDWQPGGRVNPYQLSDAFHEPLVLFSFLAGLTKKIGFTSGVLVLGQRQTALVAKQAAEVDVLSGGRLRLGVAIGWNDVEYQALGMDFHNRGARIEEQIALLRALWTQESVTFEGRWHTVIGAGINPLPVQRPIPLWFGGQTDAAMKRAARIGDGFIFGTVSEDTAGVLERLRSYVNGAGRDAVSFGIEGRGALAGQTPEKVAEEIQRWQSLGATHAAINTMNAGLKTPDEHIQAITRCRAACDIGTSP